MGTATFKLWRGDVDGGEFKDYDTEITEGMVVLDAVHQIQAESANDLAVRWNCKAGKCGSCSAEVNGMPRLLCMTRMDTIDTDKPITIEPIKAFPTMKDLVTDVSWNFEVKKKIKKFKPRAPDAEDGTWRVAQEDVDRVRNSASASNASSARMSATCFATIRKWTNSSAQGSWSMPLRSTCTLSTPRTGSRISRMSTASASATSPSAAPMSVLSISRSPTTRSSRSRNGSPTASTTR